jgi:dipeptidyl aminopeptidase/acylaminoacyl peptidase
MCSSQKDNYSIDEIMSAPFPNNLVADSRSNGIAWVFNQEGTRNIWYASEPDFRPLQVTGYSGDDGQELSGLCFSPDGKIIIYARGGGRNLNGEYQNPTSNPDGVKQEIWGVKIEGGNPWKLGEGSSPAISPKGDKVLFLSGGKIYIVPIDGSAEAKVLFEARGTCSNHSLSPDGKKLLFVSNREDHSFIGLFSIDDNKLIWIMPDVARDDYPVWSPDGRRIAFLRFPAATWDERPHWLSADLPFSICIADVANGTGREIWRTGTGGGFVQDYQRNPLEWGADNHLIFFSEHEGWMHLYSVSTDTGKVVALTPGKFEIESMTVSSDRKTVIACTNKDDIDRRHIWKAPIKGGEMKQITTGTGIEWHPVASADGKYVFYLCSTGKLPLSVGIVDVDGKKSSVLTGKLLPKSFPLDKIIEPMQVKFKSSDGTEIHGQLFLPPEKKEKCPAVIYMHGGPIRQMVLGWHSSFYYHNGYAFNQYLASKGYVVLSVNYRAGIGYGTAFRTAPGTGPEGSSEYQDIVAAAKYLQARKEVNPLKIGLWGGSYGGLLTALGLARDSDLFAAGVDIHGVHDWSLRARRHGAEDWGTRSSEELTKSYYSSPVADVNSWTSPVLFIHGDDDRNVDFIQTTDLVERLKKIGKAHVETLIFPDEIHGFLLHSSWIRAFKTADDFFRRFLTK